MDYIGPFSSTSNVPWGFAHIGVDFFPIANLAPFQAFADGIIDDVSLSQADDKRWRVAVTLKINSTYSVVYTFETFSTKEDDGRTQLQNIEVGKGKNVKPGDLIGKLLLGDSGAHVDFGFVRNSDRVSPEPYFTQATLKDITDVLHKKHSDWKLTF